MFSVSFAIVAIVHQRQSAKQDNGHFLLFLTAHHLEILQRAATVSCSDEQLQATGCTPVLCPAVCRLTACAA